MRFKVEMITKVVNARTYIQPHYGNGFFWQCLPFSWTTLGGKHCLHSIAIMRVVDTFGQHVLWKSELAVMGPVATKSHYFS